MKTIMTIVGARPQFIKAATISRALKEQHPNTLKEIIVHTGQHYDANMSAVFFDEMDIPQPNCRLHAGGQSHGAMTGNMLAGLEKLMMHEKPDCILVYGDTNSTLAGALSAAKLHIPVAHVEAGLRSFDRKMPEEINRITTDHISDLLFAPTETGQKQLAKEGITKGVHVVGDVMYDAVLFYQNKARPSDKVKSLPHRFYLATCHRQENTDNEGRLRGIFKALKALTSHYPVVLPLHPRTKKCLEKYGIETQGIYFIEPVGYFDMLYLLHHAHMVLTDSGGLQKEAYYVEKPVVIMRDHTEWTELLENGIGRITGADNNKIQDAVNALSTLDHYPKNIYGDGKAANKIVDIIYNALLSGSL